MAEFSSFFLFLFCRFPIFCEKVYYKMTKYQKCKKRQYIFDKSEEIAESKNAKVAGSIYIVFLFKKLKIVTSYVQRNHVHKSFKMFSIRNLRSASVGTKEAILRSYQHASIYFEFVYAINYNTLETYKCLECRHGHCQNSL